MASQYLLLFLFLLLIFLKTVRKFFYSKTNCKLPPGPWTVPIIGSLHHLIGAGLDHRVLRNLSQRHGELFFLQLGEHPTVVVSSTEAAREILKVHDLAFSCRPLQPTVQIFCYGGKGIVFTPYSEYWRNVRKICVSKLLNSKHIQSFRFIREDEVRSFIRQITSLSSRGQIINLTEKLMAVSNNVLLQAIMGSKLQDQKSILDNIIKGVEIAGDSFNLANLFPSSRIARKISPAVRKAEWCHRSFDKLLENIIREYKEKGLNGEAEDFLTVLLRLHEDPDHLLSIVTVKAIILDLVIAGSDSTAAVMDWVMAELMKNPTVMKKAQSELRRQIQSQGSITEANLPEVDYIHQIIKETLRLHPITPLILRKCRETCKIFGYDIPNGTDIIINTWAIGRNSKYWKDADEFRPERFAGCKEGLQFNGMDFELIPFGWGRRICPGMSFAIAKLELLLTNLLYHFDWEIPSGVMPDQVDMTEKFGVLSRRKYPLLLYARPYHTCSKLD